MHHVSWLPIIHDYIPISVLVAADVIIELTDVDMYDVMMMMMMYSFLRWRSKNENFTPSANSSVARKGSERVVGKDGDLSVA